jgi:hypothetical protein
MEDRDVACILSHGIGGLLDENRGDLDRLDGRVDGLWQARHGWWW